MTESVEQTYPIQQTFTHDIPEDPYLASIMERINLEKQEYGGISPQTWDTFVEEMSYKTRVAESEQYLSW